MAISILLFEDSPTDAYLLRKQLEHVGGFSFTLKHVSSFATGLSALSAESFDVVLFDLGLPDSIGPKSISKLRACTGIGSIIVLSGNEQPGVMEKSLNNGAFAFLLKHHVTAEEIASTILKSLGGEKS